MRGTGAFAELLSQRFKVACKRLGLASGEGSGSAARTDLFTPSTGRGGATAQDNSGQFEMF